MARLISLLSFLVVVSIAAASHAVLPAQEYWNKVLPNTPMPTAIRHFLYHSDALAEEMTDGTLYVTLPPRVPRIFRRPFHRPFLYRYAATEPQIREDPHVTFFFLEKDLYRGSELTLRFSGETSTAGGFIPRREADSIPFASDKFSEILQRVSVSPGSESAMRKTVAECEEPATDGEKKKCATSLESMVDFATSSLGTRDVTAVSTTAVKGDAARERAYTVSSVRRLTGEETVACHSESYAYAVFYCHTARAARGYLVDLVAEDGEAEVEAVAVCHEDTTGWNPGHAAFKVLKVRPGTVPVCHFLPEDHVLWARKE